MHAKLVFSVPSRPLVSFFISMKSLDQERKRTGQGRVPKWWMALKIEIGIHDVSIRTLGLSKHIFTPSLFFGCYSSVFSMIPMSKLLTTAPWTVAVLWTKSQPKGLSRKITVFLLFLPSNGASSLPPGGTSPNVLLHMMSSICLVDEKCYWLFEKSGVIVL